MTDELSKVLEFQLHEEGKPVPDFPTATMTAEEFGNAISWLMDATDCGANEDDKHGIRLLRTLAELNRDDDLIAELNDTAKMLFIGGEEEPTADQMNAHADGTRGLVACDNCKALEANHLSDWYICENCGKWSPPCTGSDDRLDLCDPCWLASYEADARQIAAFIRFHSDGSGSGEEFIGAIRTAKPGHNLSKNAADMLTSAAERITDNEPVQFTSELVRALSADMPGDNARKILAGW